MKPTDIPFACTVVPYGQYGYRATDVWFGLEGYDTSPELASKMCEEFFQEYLTELRSMPPESLYASQEGIKFLQVLEYLDLPELEKYYV